MTKRRPAPEKKVMLAAAYAAKTPNKTVPVTAIDTWWEKSQYGGRDRAFVLYENSDGTIRSHSIEEYEYEYYSRFALAVIRQEEDVFG